MAKDQQWRDDWNRRYAANQAERERLLEERAEHDRHDGIYYCCICLEEQVHPEKGEDTCPVCLEVVRHGCV